MYKFALACLIDALKTENVLYKYFIYYIHVHLYTLQYMALPVLGTCLNELSKEYSKHKFHHYKTFLQILYFTEPGHARLLK